MHPVFYFHSLFIWSNETLNIWSHLGGFFLFVLMALYDNLIILPRLGSSVYDHIILTIGLSCYTVSREIDHFSYFRYYLLLKVQCSIF